LTGNRDIPRLTVARSACGGPHREGEEPKPMMHGRGKSDAAIVAVKPTNKVGRPAAEPVEPRAATEGNAGRNRTRRAQNRASVSQALGRIRQAARQRKKERFTALYHHLGIELVEEAFFDLQKSAAAGVDGMTWQDYAADHERKLADLHARVQRGAYRALPSRRVYIPKPDGRQRPLAVAALEDKIVQRATAAVLNAIYEEDFLGFSYGFRPRPGALAATQAGEAGRHHNAAAVTHPSAAVLAGEEGALDVDAVGQVEGLLVIIRQRAVVASMEPRTAVGSATSPAKVSTRSASRPARAAARRSVSRSTSITRAPSARKRRAAARPTLPQPPVMTQTLSSSRGMGPSFGS